MSATHPGREDTLRFAARDGRLLSCRRWTPAAATTRPPLVLLHGAASNGGRWWDFVERSRLAADHVILRPDLRGHGASVDPDISGMERWCQDLDDLLDAAGQPRAVVGGHCLGANLAAHHAASRPPRCAGLVLVEPMLRTALLGSMARVRHLAPLLHLSLPLIRLGNRLGLRRRALQTVDLRALDLAFRHRLEAPEGKAAMKGRYASPLHDLRVMHLGQYLNNLLQVLRPLPLADIRAPTLALLSRGRFLADPDRTEAGLSALSGVRIERLAAEHWIPTEQPQAMAAAIDAFVTSLPG